MHEEAYDGRSWVCDRRAWVEETYDRRTWVYDRRFFGPYRRQSLSACRPLSLQTQPTGRTQRTTLLGPSQCDSPARRRRQGRGSRHGKRSAEGVGCRRRSAVGRSMAESLCIGMFEGGRHPDPRVYLLWVIWHGITPWGIRYTTRNHAYHQPPPPPPRIFLTIAPVVCVHLDLGMRRARAGASRRLGAGAGVGEGGVWGGERG